MKDDTSNGIYINELSGGQTYYFKIRATKVLYNDDGEIYSIYSDYTSPIPVTPYNKEDAPDVKTPVISDIISDSSSVTLKWNHVNGADRYDIWIDDLPAKVYGGENYVNTNSYTISGLEPETEYKFEIQAVDIIDGVEYWSEYSPVFVTTDSKDVQYNPSDEASVYPYYDGTCVPDYGKIFNLETIYETGRDDLVMYSYENNTDDLAEYLHILEKEGWMPLTVDNRPLEDVILEYSFVKEDENIKDDINTIYISVNLVNKRYVTMIGFNVMYR